MVLEAVDMCSRTQSSVLRQAARDNCESSELSIYQLTADGVCLAQGQARKHTVASCYLRRCSFCFPNKEGEPRIGLFDVGIHLLDEVPGSRAAWTRLAQMQPAIRRTHVLMEHDRRVRGDTAAETDTGNILHCQLRGPSEPSTFQNVTKVLNLNVCTGLMHAS